MPLLVLRTTVPPKGGTETLLPLPACLKLAMLYELCIAPSLLITHYSLLIAFQMPLLVGLRFTVSGLLQTANCKQRTLSLARTLEPMNLRTLSSFLLRTANS